MTKTYQIPSPLLMPTHPLPGKRNITFRLEQVREQLGQLEVDLQGAALAEAFPMVGELGRAIKAAGSIRNINLRIQRILS